jgi:hypothetical protein
MDSQNNSEKTGEVITKNDAPANPLTTYSSATQPPSPSPLRNKHKKRLIIGIIVVVALYFSGILGLTVNTISCGEVPAIYSNFAAANSYHYLNQDTMSYIFEMPMTAIFWDKYDCSAEAEHKGDKQEKAADLAKIREESTYRSGAVGFPVYTPSYVPPGSHKDELSVMPGGKDSKNEAIVQTFSSSDPKKGGDVVFLTRQGWLEGNGNPCEESTDCQKVGVSKQGFDIWKGAATNILTAYQIKNGQSYFEVELEGNNLSYTQVVKVINSIQKVN